MSANGQCRYYFAFLSCWALVAQVFTAPAGFRPAVRATGQGGIIPGGRVIAPLGEQLSTGPGPFGLALSPGGKFVATANIGMERFSVTVCERDKKGLWLTHHFVAAHGDGSDVEDKEWRSLFTGIVFSGEKLAYLAEGNSGRIRLVDVASGVRKRVIDLNEDGFADSFTGDLAFDAERNLLYVLDQANFRLVVVDAKKNRVIASVKVGRLPFALALSPDGKRAYVTNLGMFEYSALAGVTKQNAREKGLPFPAFGFPSAEAESGARRQTATGEIAVPGLGDPNRREANSLCVVNVEDAAHPKVETFIRTGLDVGKSVAGGSGPSGVVATASQIFVSNAHNDSVTVIDAAKLTVSAEIEIRISGLEGLRGVMPLGMAYDPASGWLLVAEGGINALGVIDPKQGKVLGHIPVGWFPTRVAIGDGMVFAANLKGRGTGPNLPGAMPQGEGFVDVLRRGTISVFPLPTAAELQKHTTLVMLANGFLPSPGAPKPIPEGIRHVVLIVKENRTFDEVFGDITKAANSFVAGAPPLARLGSRGHADGRGTRLSLQTVNITPNHHAMAKRWAIADNFYADSEVSVDGHHWLVGAYPDAWTESSLLAGYGGQKDFRFPTTAPGRLLNAESNSSVHPEEQGEAGSIWHHLDRHGISFRNFGEGFELAGIDEGKGLKPTGARYLTNVPMPEPLYRNTSREYPGFNMNIPDQFRADRFIQEIDTRYVKGTEPLPRFIYIHLPNDHMTAARPEDGYPYMESFVGDNDYALGRIVEYLSHSAWWKEMAIFVTEDDAQGGRDHIDSHRTVWMGVGPWFQKNYVTHMHSSFPGLQKTIFRILKLPPLNLFDASASDLSDTFTTTPDFEPYRALPEDARLFEPDKAKEPMDGHPSVKMDGPESVAGAKEK